MSFEPRLMLTEEQYAKRIEDLKASVVKLRALKARINVQSYIEVHMIHDHAGGWAHTHGMWDIFELPDLEIRDVHPSFLLVEAGITLNTIAQYMIDQQCSGKPNIQAGQNMGVNPKTLVSFKVSEPLDPTDAEETKSHFSTPRLQVIDVPGIAPCDICDKKG